MRKISFSPKGLKKAKPVEPLPPQNDYYEDVSAGLGIFQVVLYLSLFAFVVLSFFKNTNLITYRNFYYFFKDLNASAETVDVLATDSVTYPTGGKQSFTLYRKGLAVAGEYSVTVFTATGRQTVSANLHYENPVAVGAGKYLLVYDLGGTRYSLYNSYTQVYDGKSEFPINGAAVSDSGRYALISSSENYASVVSLYSDSFSLLNRYLKKGYVMDVAITEKGDRVAILTSSPKDAAFETLLEIYRPGQEAAEATASVGTSLGLSLHFTASGALSILSTDGISYADSRGRVTSVFDFGGSEISSVANDREGIAVLLKPKAISEKNILIVFDKDGKMLYNKAVTETVEQISRSGQTVYLLSAGKIGRLQVKSGELDYLTCHTEQRHILALDENEVLLCSPQKAEYLRFGS